MVKMTMLHLNIQKLELNGLKKLRDQNQEFQLVGMLSVDCLLI